jgi:poly(A) polymerase
MLRAARFVATLGMLPTADVVAAMTELSPQLARITAERVQVELSKLLLGPDPRAGIELLVDTGLADIVLPEIPALRMADDEHGQHKDVYAHTLQVLEQAMDLEDGEPDLVLRMAALMHDIGKPATRAFMPGGRVSFHHHEAEGRKMTRERLRALRYGKQFIEDVSRLVFLHLRFYGYRDGEWTDSAVRRYVVDAGPLLARLHKLVRSDCTTRNKRKALMLSASYDALEQRIAELQEQEELQAIRPDLDGNEIMRILDIGPGPAVGRAWQYLKDLRMEQGPLDHDRAVAELRRWWEQQSH